MYQNIMYFDCFRYCACMRACARAHFSPNQKNLVKLKSEDNSIYVYFRIYEYYNTYI